jgi:hypothetical protein
MVKNISIDNDENGHILICLYGKRFVSTEPVTMTEGKFKVSDIEKLVFVGQKSHDTIVFYPEKKNMYFHIPRQER